MGLVKNVTAYFFGGSTSSIENWNMEHCTSFFPVHTLFTQLCSYNALNAKTSVWHVWLCCVYISLSSIVNSTYFHAYIIMTWLCDNIKHVYSVLNSNTGINYFIARIKIYAYAYALFCSDFFRLSIAGNLQT